MHMVWICKGWRQSCGLAWAKITGVLERQMVTDRKEESQGLAGIRWVMSVGVMCAGCREGEFLSVLEVLAIAAAGQVRSWEESTHGQRWPEGCHEEPQSPQKGEGSARLDVEGYCSAELKVDYRARNFCPMSLHCPFSEGEVKSWVTELR